MMHSTLSTDRSNAEPWTWERLIEADQTGLLMQLDDDLRYMPVPRTEPARGQWLLNFHKKAGLAIQHTPAFHASRAQRAIYDCINRMFSDRWEG